MHAAGQLQTQRTTRWAMGEGLVLRLDKSDPFSRGSCRRQRPQAVAVGSGHVAAVPEVLRARRPKPRARVTARRLQARVGLCKLRETVGRASASVRLQRRERLQPHRAHKDREAVSGDNPLHHLR